MKMSKRLLFGAVSFLGITVCVAGCAGSGASAPEATDTASEALGPDCAGELNTCYGDCGMGPASCYTNCEKAFRKCIGAAEIEVAEASSEV